MGVGYELVNFSRKEFISYAHIPVLKQCELAGNPVSAAITTWYLLEHLGDQISFISDSDEDWPFPGSRDEFRSYQDKTDAVVDQLVNAGILTETSREWEDTDNPDQIYIRGLKNIWMS